MEEAGGLVSMGVVVNSQAQGPVTGIFFSIGPGPFFSEITLKILVQGYMFRWTKIFNVVCENFGPGPFLK